MNRDEVLSVIAETVQEYNETLEPKAQLQFSVETALIGEGAVLDSLELVRFVVELETKIEERFGVSAVLSDDRAMSQRNSPFRTIGTLADYLVQVLGRDR